MAQKVIIQTGLYMESESRRKPIYTTENKNNHFGGIHYTLENLIKLVRERKSSPIDGSYTNKLLTDKSLSKAKVLEEVNELIEAIDENSNKIHEAADVFYHLLMYLEANDIKIEDVMSELEKRKK